MIKQELISHQVFESIQGGISDSPMGKGTIIFANKYTGELVEMSDELRSALSMNGTFIGNNPINQLDKALNGVPGGPWVIDVRNDILYIHNRAINQPANYEYVYGSENGELLKVSFKTQYRTKNVPVGGTKDIDQFSKTLIMQSNSQTSTSDIVGDDTDRTAKSILIKKARRLYLEAKADTMYPRVNKGGGTVYTKSESIDNFLSYININLRRKGKATLGNDVNKLYDMSLENLTSWYDSYLSYISSKVQVSLDKYTRTSSSSDLRYFQKYKSNEVYQSQSYEDLSKNMLSFMDKTIGGGKYRKEVERELREAYKKGPEAVSEVLHRYFDNTVYKQYTHSGLNEVRNIDVANLFKGDGIIPPTLGSGNIYFTKSDGRFKQSGEGVGTGSIVSGVTKVLKASGYSGITITAYDVKRTFTGLSCKLKANYKQNMRNYKVISGYQLLYDHYLRSTHYSGKVSGGSSGGSNADYSGRMGQLISGQASAANTSRKVTQQRLVVEMVVVGRPSLTTNGKIKISNIGNRSGDYLIERCIHQITSGEGYTCSLTLSQGVHNEPVGTELFEVPITSKPKNSGGGTSGGAGNRSRGDGKGGTVNTSPKEPISIWYTPGERAYFNTLLTSKDNVSAQEEFVTQVKYSREKAYNDARKAGKSDKEAREAVRKMNQTGIVEVKKGVSSDNTTFNERLEPKYNNGIPQRYRIGYRDEVRSILQKSSSNIKSRLNK